MIRRPFTRDEWIAFVLAASRVRDEIDATLGALLLRVAKGDDAALADVHDRLAVLGDFDGADRVRELVTRV